MYSRLFFLPLLLLILLQGGSHVVAQSFSVTDLSQAALVNASAIDGGDYDGDGDLDLLVRWNDAGTWKAEVLRNTSTAATISFATTGIVISNVSGDCIWADLNNDSKLDIIASGDNGGLNFLTAFINNAGTFTTQIPISADLATNLDWGDVDADGDQDLLVTKPSESFLLTRTGTSQFSREMPNTFSENSILADYNLDGDLDVIGDGIYTNYISEFLETHDLFPTAFGYYNRGRMFASDLDGDGDRDFLRAEDTRARGTEFFLVVAYLNQQNIFSRVELESVDDFVGTIFPIGAGDFDNNGDVEAVYVPNGNYSQYLLRFKEIKGPKVTTIDLPPNSRFHSVGGYLIADLNGDQRLDIITTGGYVNTSTSESVQYAKSFRNLAGVNAKPTVPTNLTVSTQGPSVTLSWNKSTDATTPAGGITYNFYLRQGLDTLISPYATKSGKPRVHNIKGTAEANEFKIPALANNGSYYWAVQSRDAAGNYSAFSTEKYFEFTGGKSEVNHSSGLTSQSISYDPKNDQYILVGLQGGNVYAVLLDGQFGERKTVPKKLNQFTATCKSPKVAVDSAGTYLVTWIADSLTFTERLWGKFVKSDLSVPQANEWRACEKVFPGLPSFVYIQSHDVRYNPARNAFDLAWVFYGETGGMSARRTRLQANANKPDPIRNIAWTYISGYLHGARGFLDISIDSDPKAGKSVVAYTFEEDRADGVSSYGKVFFRQLDQNLLSTKDSIAADKFPNDQEYAYGSAPHVVYNPYLKNFTVIWNAHFQHQLSILPQDGVVESRDVAAAILAFDTNGSLTKYQFPSTISKTQQQGGQGGSLNPNLSFNYGRNEFLVTWHNTNAGKIYGKRINPLYKVTIGEEFPIKESLSETPAASFAKEQNHFILGFSKDGGGTTSIIEMPDDPAPVVASLSKIRGRAGEKVTITGTNFGTTPYLNSVYFGNVKATVDTLFWNETKLQVTVPSGLTRVKVPVVVKFDGQLSNATVLFENISETLISSVDPIEGHPGDLVTITGTNFPNKKDEYEVKFGDVTVPPTDKISDTTFQLILRVPQNAVRGAQNITVVIQEEDNVYKQNKFDVIRIPSIESIAPADGGQELISDRIMEISGSNFSFKPGASDVAVKIGEFPVDGARVKAPDSRTLQVQIPTGIEGTQTVTVSTDNGDATKVLNNFVLGGEVRSNAKDTYLRFNSGRVDDFVSLYVEVYNYETVQEIKFLTKGISDGEGAWTQKQLPVNANRIDHLLEEGSFPDDPIGLQGYYEISDASGLIKRSDTVRVFRDNIASGATAPIPDLRFGGTIADYNIVSIPYELLPNKINTVFKSILDVHGYDPSKWRILHYDNETGKYVEYLKGLDAIDPGKGYWIIARYPQEVPFDIGKTLNKDFGPFKLILNPGWNQIGNPYDFNISWSDVIDHNEDMGVSTSDLESFKTFKDGSFLEVNTIDRFRGGFVLNNGPKVELEVPFTKDPSINGGRKKDDVRHFASKLDEKEWRLALDLSAGQLKNLISSFGMHPQADEGVDEKDEHKLPAFVQSLDLSFPHSLSTSIVGTGDHHSWDIEVVNTTDSKEVTLYWDNTTFGENDRELFLQDNSAQRLIDMRKENHYTFTYTEGYTFKIHFGDKSYIEDIAKPSNVVLSDAYPNPMRSTTRIPFTVTKDKTHVHLGIYSLQGQELLTLVNDNLAPGFYEFEWDGKTTTGEEINSGVVIYRLQTSDSGNGVKSHYKKLIIEP